MSIFGDLETPESNEPENTQVVLTEITLKIFEATFDPSTNLVKLRLEATPIFSDGSICKDDVALFLNGHLLCSVTPNDYGIATIDGAYERQMFQNAENELSARLKGYGKQGIESFQLTERSLTISQVSHRWNSVVQFKRNAGSRAYDTYRKLNDNRYEGLTIKVQSKCKGHEFFSLEGIQLEFRSLGSQGQSMLISESKIDVRGIAVFELPEIFIDEPGHLEKMYGLGLDSIYAEKGNDEYYDCGAKENVTFGNAIYEKNQETIYLSHFNCDTHLDQKPFFDHLMKLPLRNNLWGLSLSIHAPGWPGTNTPLNVDCQKELFVT